MANRPLRIGIVAGEASGDVLAAGLIKKLKQQHPDAIIEGIGGQHMISAGCHSLFDIETLSVMGLTEVLSSIRSILALKKQLIAHFKANPPDVYIGVDAPDFNLRVETELKAFGIKTVHYVSPTVWAWREKRIHKIAKATHLVLGVFPFEQQVYDKYQVPYQFVGHTLADAVALVPDQQEARQQLQLPVDGHYIAMLPGSRRGEVNALLPIFMATIDKLWAEYPSHHIIIPAANQRRFEQISTYIHEHSPSWLTDERVHLIEGESRTAMIASDAILLASGTATLEAMLCKRPMVTAYKMSWLTFKMMQRLYKAPYFALPNILANEELIPELLQEDVNPQTLSETLLGLLRSDNSELIARFTQLHHVLRKDADSTSAKAILEMIDD